MNGTDLIQRWARRLGVGRETGIDLPAELPGPRAEPALARPRVPQVHALRRAREARARRRCSPPAAAPTGPGRWATTSTCRSGRATCAPTRSSWRSPTRRSRTAATWCARTSGCGSRTPRAGRSRSSRPPRHAGSSIEATDRQAILDGLYGAANEPGGTSTPVFEGFPIPIAGKTGTAEKGVGRADQSWYVALAPYPDPQYVVVVTDEAGGFGAETAAPMARQILAALFDVKDEEPARGGRERPRLMQASASSPREGVPRGERRAHRADRPAAAARDARADRRQHLHDRDRHPGRRRRAAPTTTSSGSRVRGRGPRADAAGRALRLLAPARAEARPLRRS